MVLLFVGCLSLPACGNPEGPAQQTDAAPPSAESDSPDGPASAATPTAVDATPTAVDATPTAVDAAGADTESTESTEETPPAQELVPSALGSIHTLDDDLALATLDTELSAVTHAELAALDYRHLRIPARSGTRFAIQARTKGKASGFSACEFGKVPSGDKAVLPLVCHFFASASSDPTIASLTLTDTEGESPFLDVDSVAAVSHEDRSVDCEVEWLP